MRRWLSWLCVPATVATALASAGGCRQIVGISDSPKESLTSVLCGLPYGTSSCAECVNQSCCTASTACAADDVCAAYEGCLGGCKGDPQCRSQCRIDHPGGVATDVIALSTCMASHCETACGLTCGGIADLRSPPSAARACDQCLAMSACAQAEACATSQVCNGYLRADATFATIDSTEVYEANLCASGAAAGLSLNIEGFVDVCGSPGGIGKDPDASLAQVATSFLNTCSSACAVGTDWSCVGHVNWPSPKAPTCVIDYRITDYVTSAPVSGALVQVCAPADVTCAQPLASGTTDANGMLSLPVPNRSANSLQSLDGFSRISGPNVFTNNAYWGFPLIEDSLLGIQQVTSPTETQQLLAAVQSTPIAGRGILTVRVFDCLNAEAPGVTVTLSTGDASTKGFNTNGVATTVTDDTGIIFFVNVPSGLTTITSTPMGLSTPAAETRVYVQPDVATDVYVWKTPSP